MKKIVKLKPINEFFFGGDLTFGNIDEYNYIAKSTLFPQQTALLGMLRKTLLKQNNLLTTKIKIESVDNRQKAEQLVGKGKFVFQKEAQNFGVIKRISPIFLINKETKYIKKAGVDYEIKKDEIGYFLEKDGEVFNGKDYLFSDFISIDKNQSLKEDNIFEEIEKIGIKKDSDEKGFFKKYSYILKDDFEFAFYVEFEDEDFKFEDDIIELGADRSAFKMSVKDCDEWLEFEDENLILLSPSYIENIRDLSSFAITQDINFRFIKYKRSFKKSNVYKLYDKGSVFVDYKPELINQINEYKNLQKIGLNIISKEKK